MAHVLVVDDDEDIRLTMRTLLEDVGGHTVLEAANGMHGLQQLRASEQRLVVLLDVLMPGLDGIDVLRAVATDEQLATRHAYLLVSASPVATPPDIPVSLKLGLDVVPKPFDIANLLEAVAQANHRIQASNTL